MPQKAHQMQQKQLPTLADLKLISEDKVPTKMKRSSQQWLSLAKGIPKGQALVGTEKQFGVNGSSIKLMFARLKKTGLVSSEYHVTQRTEGDTVTIYIVHSAKTTEE